jgi:hypothetical protein
VLQQVTEFELTINLKIAKAFGLPAARSREEVIE